VLECLKSCYRLRFDLISCSLALSCLILTLSCLIFPPISFQHPSSCRMERSLGSHSVLFLRIDMVIF
jgi:hypothetical protein